MSAEALKSALCVSEMPSRYFVELREQDTLLPEYRELFDLIGVPQDPIRHPEGDVWTHTMQVIDRAAGLRDKASDPFAFMLLALTHDFGKTVTTEFLNGRYHSYGHETAGVSLAERFLERIGVEESKKCYVLAMIPLHMKPGMTVEAHSSVKTTNHMFGAAADPRDLILMALSDKPRTADFVRFLEERLQLYRETMARPFVTREDLMAAGVREADLPRAIDYAHKLRLSGVDKDLCLRQTIAFAAKRPRPD